MCATLININLKNIIMKEAIKPIKRDPALVQFSRDHHFGLLLVWKIRQGLRANIEPERITNYVKFFFQEDLVHHFAEEESHLFVKLSEDDPMRLRAENEHNEMQELLAQLENQPSDISILNKIALTLEKHIRFEERELFNRLQSTMSEKELLDLLNEVPERDPINEEHWDDKFWLFKS
jgi:hemerythrin-like domain-containing protein